MMNWCIRIIRLRNCKKPVLDKLQEINIEQIKESGGIAVVMDNYIEFTKFIDKLMK